MRAWLKPTRQVLRTYGTSPLFPFLAVADEKPKSYYRPTCNGEFHPTFLVCARFIHQKDIQDFHLLPLSGCDTSSLCLVQGIQLFIFSQVRFDVSYYESPLPTTCVARHSPSFSQLVVQTTFVMSPTFIGLTTGFRYSYQDSQSNYPIRSIPPRLLPAPQDRRVATYPFQGLSVAGFSTLLCQHEHLEGLTLVLSC